MKLNGRTITSKRARPNPNVRQVVKRETKILVNNALFADSDNSTPQQIRRGASISAFHIVKYWEREKHWKICRDEFVLATRKARRIHSEYYNQFLAFLLNYNEADEILDYLTLAETS